MIKTEMTETKLFDKLSEIKKQLDKHSQTRDIVKIKAYLNELNNIENVNLEILKRSEIVDCLKSLKKKDDPNFSHKAEKIIKKWKNIVTQMAEKVNVENTKSNIIQEKRESSEKKRSFVEGAENTAKKPKLNGTIQTFSEKNSVNPTKKDDEKSVIVPMPTARLEDIVSTEALPSSEFAPRLRNVPNMSANSNLMPKVDGLKPINQVDDDEALSKILKNKHSKRTLYTGRKPNLTGATFQVGKLFDLASKVLIENLDELHLRILSYNHHKESVYPVPYDLIKRILERASAKQLQSIEYYNPNLQSDTDELWKKLCEQEFKKVELSEDETWRELYYRKIDEREEKFRRARDLISKKQAEKPKERQTKHATAKFVASTARSSSTTLSHSAAASKFKSISSSNAPVRQIVHDSSDRRGGNASGPRKPAISAPAMSQGMRATMKLIKKTTSRR